MSHYKTKLLSTNNYKTMKGAKLGYITYIMYLSPFTDNTKGINLCPHASKGCAAACLFKSGFGGMYQNVINGRRNKTEWFLEDRADFLATLDMEVGKAIKKNAGKAIPVFRLNGTSDIMFERFKIRDDKNIFELYPDVQFYDYTKNPNRFDKVLPANYHLTFSRSEVNHKVALGILKRGFNVAMVFNKVPATFEGHKVIIGDETDLRFKDESGVIVGLSYKFSTGKNADNEIAFTTGFAIAV